MLKLCQVTAATLACAGLILTGHATSSAQENGPQQASMFDGMTLSLGGAVGFGPKYEGSDEYDVSGFPIVFPGFGQSIQRIVVRGADDVRYRLILQQGFEAGPLAGYRWSRKESDGRLLRGLGEVDGGLVLGGFVGYRVGQVIFDAAYLQQATGENTGYQIRFGAEIDAPVYNQVFLEARAGTTFSSDRYMDTYFGVTEAQSDNSAAGLPVYNPSSGLKDVHLQLGVRAEIYEKWLFRTGVRYGRLLNDAADSPVIESKNQFSGFLSLSYKFDISRFRR